MHLQNKKTVAYYIILLSVVLIFISAPTYAQNSAVINVSGGVAHSVHGIDTIKDTLWGENLGSGGYGGADKINATWFRNTSPCNIMKGIVESKENSGYADKTELIKRYPATGINKNKKTINRVKLFHSKKINYGTTVWPPRPFSGRKGDRQQSEAWAEICAAYVANDMRPYADGSYPQTMWEFGNEVMWHHYLNAPQYNMDPNVQGPGCNGENAATAYRQWVYYATKAIKQTVPNARIMAGSGDMITYSSGDWWGWKYWDKPFLDLCIPYIDAYATHWYSTVPEQMVIEAALIHNYTLAKYKKGIPTHVTEYNIPNVGALSSKKEQWARTSYDVAMLAAALRDPDKIEGLYRFIYSDPRFMTKYQVKKSILETWLKLTKNLRGKRILSQSDTADVFAVSSQSEDSIVTLVCNNKSETEQITLNINSPAGNSFSSIALATLAYDSDADAFIQSNSTNSYNTEKSKISIITNLTSGASIVVTSKLRKQSIIDKTVETDEYIPNDVLTPAEREINISIPAAKVQRRFTMLRFGLESRSSRWSDLWVNINGHLYKLPVTFWRRPCMQIDIPVKPEHIKNNNTIKLLSGNIDDVTVITAAIELSDTKLSPVIPSPYSRALVVQMPQRDLYAGQAYPIEITALGGNIESITPKDVKFKLPENWTIKPIASSSNSYKLQIPDTAIIDWYPIETEIVIGKQKYILRNQIKVNTPVECYAFSSPPVIDGNLLEWSDVKDSENFAPVEDFDILVWTPGHRKSIPTGNMMKTGWTKDGFYFAASFSTNNIKKPWLDFFFDMNRDRAIGKWDRNDHQFKVELKENGAAFIKQIIWDDSAPRIEINPQPESKVRWQEKDGKILVEGYIPATAFNVFKPFKGNLIGFDFRINNKIQWYSRSYEQAQNQFPSTKSWGREQIMRNPATWGWLRFN